MQSIFNFQLHAIHSSISKNKGNEKQNKHIHIFLYIKKKVDFKDPSPKDVNNDNHNNNKNKQNILGSWLSLAYTNYYDYIAYTIMIWVM